VNDCRAPGPPVRRYGFIVLVLFAVLRGHATDFTALCADRMAVERAYYNHRVGDKAPFEETMPPSLVERLVREDQRKEAVLKKVYNVEVTATMVETEVQRINNTSRSPEMLAEIKRTLGNDPGRFARAVARPLVAERVLRQHFEDDNRLHETTRRQADQLRNELLAATKTNASPHRLVALMKTNTAGTFHERVWHLTRDSKGGALSSGPPPATAKSSNGLYALEGVARLAGPGHQAQHTPGETPLYFEDLPPELRAVLRTQLRNTGDISAVIETPDSFLLFVATQRTAQAISAASVSVPKRRFVDWLAGQ
jgi:hypothetical protein